MQLEVPSYAEVDNQDLAQKNKIAKWTFIFYMCADNNLESAAIQDINEMEAAEFDESEINILALLDRSEFYDDSNGNWTGTRLLKISHDAAGVNNKIISPEIACEDLGISLGTEKELDMADYNNLSALLNFCCRNYAAEHYALIIWGHGTGYRSFQLSDFGTQTKVRAVAVDGSSGNFMETPNLRKAIESGMKRKLDFLGFDTCFASELEELYELRNCTLYFAGSEGTQSESGWDYKEWFSENIAACTDGLSLCRLLENQHIQKEDSTFAIIEMSKIEKVFTAFDSFAIQASHIVKNKSVGSEIKEKLFLQKRAFRVYNSMTNPLYLDIFELSQNLLVFDSSLERVSENLLSALKSATKNRQWKSEAFYPIGIYFCSFDENNQLIEDFSSYYKHGSGAVNQCMFVQESVGYVFTESKSGTLLDRLFENYNF